ISLASMSFSVSCEADRGIRAPPSSGDELRRLFDGLGARLFGSLARGEAGSVQRAVVRAFKPEGAELARDDQHRGEASVEGFVLGVLCCGHVILPFRFRSRSGRAVFALQIEFVVWVAKPAP